MVAGHLVHLDTALRQLRPAECTVQRVLRGLELGPEEGRRPREKAAADIVGRPSIASLSS